MIELPYALLHGEILRLTVLKLGIVVYCEGYTS